MIMGIIDVVIAIVSWAGMFAFIAIVAGWEDDEK